MGLILRMFRFGSMELIFPLGGAPPRRDLSWGYCSRIKGYNVGFQGPIFGEICRMLSGMGLVVIGLLEVGGRVYWRWVVVLSCKIIPNTCIIQKILLLNFRTLYVFSKPHKFLHTADDIYIHFIHYTYVCVHDKRVLLADMKLSTDLNTK